MNGVTVLETVKAHNLAELRQILMRMSQRHLEQIPDAYVTINDSSVIVRLERQTLTDSSEVYNINIEVTA